MMFASYRTHVIKLIENKDLIAQISLSCANICPFALAAHLAAYLGN